MAARMSLRASRGRAANTARIRSRASYTGKTAFRWPRDLRERVNLRTAAWLVPAARGQSNSPSPRAPRERCPPPGRCATSLTDSARLARARRGPAPGRCHKAGSAPDARSAGLRGRCADRGRYGVLEAPLVAAPVEWSFELGEPGLDLSEECLDFRAVADHSRVCAHTERLTWSWAGI